MKPTFEQKIKSLKASEILMAKVNGLRKKYYKVNMDTFGRSESDICFACAATHCITELSGVVFDEKNLDNLRARAKAVNLDYSFYDDFEGAFYSFYDDFEGALDELRRGNINSYNDYAKYLGVAQILTTDFELPELTTENWKEKLSKYEELAKIEAGKGN